MICVHETTLPRGARCIRCSRCREKGDMKALSAFLIQLEAVLPVAQSQSSYHVGHIYTLGGNQSWDYVVPDPPNHRLFTARQNCLVVDEDKGTLLGEVARINGAHGTAL